MIGSKFIAHSGNISNWVVIGSHGLFSGVWKCYPVDKLGNGKQVKESLIQCFDTDFIKSNEIFDDFPSQKK